MCCPSKTCCLCSLLILVIIVIGFVFGFGVFAHGFHKIKDALHLEAAEQGGSLNGRRFIPDAAPPGY